MFDTIDTVVRPSLVRASVRTSVRTSVVTAALFLTNAVAAQAPSRAVIAQRLDSIAGAAVAGGNVAGLAVAGGNVAGLAVAVVKGRDTLLFKGYGFADLENRVPVTPATVFRIGSVTKQFTSAAIMQLVEESKLSLDDDITKYVPNAPVHGQTILVRQLLNHTAGIPSYTDVAGFDGVARLDLSHDSLLAVVAHDSLQFEPGTHMYYSNTGYFLIGMIIEKVTGRTYGDYLASKFFAPYGMTATTYCETRKLIPHRAQGYDKIPSGLINAEPLSMDLPYAAGSLCSTIGDLVSWTTRLNSGGVANARSWREMTTPVALPSKRPMSYAFGLRPDTIGTHRLIGYDGGINGFVSFVMHLPADTLTVVVLSNTSPAPAVGIAKDLARAVLGLPANASLSPMDLPTATAERAMYAGRYALTLPDGSKQSITIGEDSGHLTFTRAGTGTAALKLAKQADGTFTATGVARLMFDVTASRATGFVIGYGFLRPLEAVRIP
jgi:D-alanyl-D-alanine carboxypeptidase